MRFDREGNVIYKCLACKDMGQIDNPNRPGYVMPCMCRAGNIVSKFLDEINPNRALRKFVETPFSQLMKTESDNAEKAHLQKLKDLCLSLVLNKDYQTVLLSGKPGAGKTAMLLKIACHLKRTDVGLLWMSAVDYFNTFSLSPNVKEFKTEQDELEKKIRSAQHIFIDDLGAELPKDCNHVILKGLLEAPAQKWFSSNMPLAEAGKTSGSLNELYGAKAIDRLYEGLYYETELFQGESKR